MVNSKPRNALIDGAMVILIVLFLSIGSVVGYNIFGDLNSEIQNDNDASNITKQTSGNLYTLYPALLDNLFLMAFVLFVVFLIVSVFLLDTHPIFFIITIVLLSSVFLVAMLLSNTYTEIMEDSEFSASANAFPYTSWVNDHLVELIVGIGFLTAILLYIKFKG